MKIPGCYLVVRGESQPSVVLLSAGQRELFDQRRGYGKRHTDNRAEAAMRQTFGNDASAVFPCWVTECMVAVAQEYTGPQQTQVRGLAAAIALGRPYGRDTGADNGGKGNGGGGGERVPRKPTKPRPGSPAKVSAFDSLMSGG